MRILHVADLHQRTEWFAWLVEQAPRYDVTVIAGDLLDMFRPVGPSGNNQITHTRAWLQAFPGKLVVCTGNHDAMPFWPLAKFCKGGRWLRVCAREDRVWIDGGRFILGGLRWEVCGWGQVGPDTGRDTDVLVVHGPPSNRGVALEGNRDQGDSVLLAAITEHQPRFVLSGHVHNPRSWFAYVGHTLCFNTGCELSEPVPAHIVIDTDANTAVWHAPHLDQIDTLNLRPIT